MKKAIIILFAFSVFLAFTGCKDNRIVHCDRCDKEIEVEGGSNVDDSWILFCEECEPEIEY